MEHDLESGLSVASAASGDEELVEFVGTTLNPSKKALWKSRIGTTPKGPSGHYNPHGMLAAQRYVAEKFACECLLANSGVIVDVGGAPHRTHQHLGERGRYMMPRVHAGDSSRIGKAPKESLEHVCHHKFEECMCYDGEEVSYLFTHSAYYIAPQVLWHRLSDGLCRDAIVVEHEFTDIYGGFYDEATWAFEREVVTMSVAGNGQPYCHTLPPWQTGWVGENGEKFSYDVLKSLDGVTRVIRVEAVQGDPHVPRALTWMEVEANPNLSGPVQFSTAVKAAVADNARFTGVSFDVHEVRKFGPVVFTEGVFRGTKVSLTLPVNGVSQVAALVTNRPRDAALYAEATHVMRNRYARARVPPSKLPMVLAAVVSLGFVVNLHNEIDLTHTMLDKFTWAMKIHSVLLQFGNVTVRRWPYFLAIALVMLAWVVPVEILDDDPVVRVSVVISAFVFLGLCVLVYRGCVVVAKKWHDYKLQSWSRSLADDSGPTAPLLGNAFTVPRNFPLAGSRYIKPVLSEMQGKMTLTATREKVEEPRRSLVSGVLIDGLLPSVLATTQDAEASAVSNRILAPRANPEQAALARFVDAFKTSLFPQTGQVDHSQTAFERWLSKIKETYPVVYVENMRATWLQYQGAVPPETATKGFLKVEKSASTVKIDEAKPTKPRLIQPPEDLDKAMTGYIVVQLYEMVRSYMDGFKSKVVYASGRSLRYVGERVDDFLQRHPDAFGWSVDMATYDATLGAELQLSVFKYYVERLNMAPWVVSWLLRVRTRGTTPNGVKYEPTRRYEFSSKADADEFAKKWRKMRFKAVVTGVNDVWYVDVEDFQMTSGRMDTNLTDTVALVASFDALKLIDDYLLLVCGDDAFLLIPPGSVWVVEAIKKHQRQLGLKPEGSLSQKRSDWEFCSKLFWYAREFGSDKDITVLGSKPFRGIARMGINTTLPGAANAAASALAVRVDSGHVPFLGKFADRTYQLCAAKKLRPTGRMEWAAMRGDKRYAPSPLNWTITQERYNLGEENEKQFEDLLTRLHDVPIVLSYLPAQGAVARDEE